MIPGDAYIYYNNITLMSIIIKQKGERVFLIEINVLRRCSLALFCRMQAKRSVSAQAFVFSLYMVLSEGERLDQILFHSGVALRPT